MKQPKYKENDRCIIVKNLLAPDCVGEIVIIKKVLNQSDTNVLYEVEIEGFPFKGMAVESVLRLCKPATDNTVGIPFESLTSEQWN